MGRRRHRIGMGAAAFVLAASTLGAGAGAGAAQTSKRGHLIAIDLRSGHARWDLAPARGRFYEGAVVSDGVVAVTDYRCGPLGSSQGTQTDPRAVGVDASTGRRRWTAIGIVQSAARKAVTSATGNTTLGAPKRVAVYGLSSATGKERWSRAGSATATSFGGSLVFISQAGGRWEARDALTAKVAWTFAAAGNAPDPLTWSRVVASDPDLTVLATGRTGSPTTTFAVLDSASGAQRATFDAQNTGVAYWSAAVAGGVLAFTDTEGLVGRDLASGAVRWTTAVELPQLAPPARMDASPDGRTVFVTQARGEQPVLTAVDTVTGAERWSIPGANYETSGSGVAVVIDHGGLEGLDASTGKHLWTAAIPHGYTTAPDTIAATTGSGLLVLTDQCDFE